MYQFIVDWIPFLEVLDDTSGPAEQAAWFFCGFFFAFVTALIGYLSRLIRLAGRAGE